MVSELGKTQMEGGRRQTVSVLLRQVGLGTRQIQPMQASFLLENLGAQDKMLCSIFEIQQIFTEVWAQTNFNKIVFPFSKNSETAMCWKSRDGWVKASGELLGILSLWLGQPCVLCTPVILKLMCSSLVCVPQCPSHASPRHDPMA